MTKEDPAKYAIKARVTANGVVERSDVVGAVFGQTEGLLGDELDLRALQEADRVGRIEVDVSSERGTSVGELTIATDMDRAETAVLAAAMETIERIGPCRAAVEIERIEDVRAAKRRRIVDRASELLHTGFEDVGVAGRDLVDAVREQSRPAEIDQYAGYPAGPDLESHDDIIVVEGRADVRRLLAYGITNVVGVEGTDVPPEIATLTRDRTVTAFFDGDRGGNMLLLELAQKGDIDYVTFAPPGRAVEDLSREAIQEALAEKVPYEDARTADEDAGGTTEFAGEVAQEQVSPSPAEPARTPPSDEATDESVTAPVEGDPGVDTAEPEPMDGEKVEPALLTHIRDVATDESGEVRVLGPDWSILVAGPVEEYTELLESVENGVEAVVIDTVVNQSEADVAARTGVPLLVGRERGEFTKRPTAVRVMTADRVLARPDE